jgi:hypothetical protein
MNPLARRSNIFAEKLPEEIVVYDKTSHKVHCLSKTAGAVWESCDGTKTVEDLAPIVEARVGAPVDRDLVVLALEELEKANLLEAGSGVVSNVGTTSRRQVIGKHVLSGTALVATIFAAAARAYASLALGSWHSNGH